MADKPNCLNKAWIDKWKEESGVQEATATTTTRESEIPILDHDTASHIADLATHGSSVAIAATDDPAYDFYLLKVTSIGVKEHSETFTDDYSCHNYKGSEVDLTL